ncbi:hypothetical protein RB195_005424 [Necator americanus]
MLKSLSPSRIPEMEKSICSTWIEGIPAPWRHAVVIPSHEKLSGSQLLRNITTASNAQGFGADHPGQYTILDIKYPEETTRDEFRQGRPTD